MSMKWLIVPMFAAVSLCSHAQRDVVVIDMETKVPVGSVVVTLDDANFSQLMTDYKGGVTIPAGVDSLIFGHPGYETLCLRTDELTDTLELLRKYRALSEVVIYGSMPQMGFSLAGSLQKMHNEMRATPRPTPLATFDFFSIFGSKKRKKTRERIEAIENY